MKKLLILMFILSTFIFAQLKVGLVTQIGGLGDKGYNDMAYSALEKAKKDFGIDFKYVEPSSPSEDASWLEEFAEAKYNIVIGVGFLMKDSIDMVAKKYPKTKFILIDEISYLPNVLSITFNTEEGSFLVGALASLMSKSQKIAFIGGMDIPIVQSFERGYTRGAKYINPNIEVLASYLSGSNPFNDPERGYEDAEFLLKEGNDVFYCFAGGSELGIISAAMTNKVYVIGSETNKDNLATGTILTSMVNRVDNALYDVIKLSVNGKFKGGEKVYGLKEKGISLTEFENTLHIIGKEKIEIIKQIEKDIINGKI